MSNVYLMQQLYGYVMNISAKNVVLVLMRLWEAGRFTKMKNQPPKYKNSDSYGYALGVFIACEVAKIDPKFFITHPEVKMIYSKILQKHENIKRKGITRSYADGIQLGSHAYDKVCSIMDGTPIAINACVRLIQMKNEKVIERVFGIDPQYFINMKQNGVQERTIASVKVANKFIEILDELFEAVSNAKVAA